jgi:hypothetical protein
VYETVFFQAVGIVHEECEIKANQVVMRAGIAAYNLGLLRTKHNTTTIKADESHYAMHSRRHLRSATAISGGIGGARGTTELDNVRLLFRIGNVLGGMGPCAKGDGSDGNFRKARGADGVGRSEIERVGQRRDGTIHQNKVKPYGWARSGYLEESKGVRKCRQDSSSGMKHRWK